MYRLHRLHRPSMRDLLRLVAVGIVVAFVVSAVSIAYAAGRHSSHDSAQLGGAHVGMSHAAPLR